MTMHDPTDYDLLVDGQVISEFAGLTGWRVMKEAGRITGPGNRVYGHTTQRAANGVDFTIAVKRSSISLRVLQDLVDNQRSVPIKAVITRNLDTYEVGQEIGLGCESGVLTDGTRGAGDSDDADNVEFTVVGIGPVREYRS